MSQWAELGRTRLSTLRERRRRLATVLVALLGVVGSAWVAAALVSWVAGSGFTFPSVGFRPVVTGGGEGGGLLGLPHAGEPAAPPQRPQVPLTLTWPVSPVWTAIVAVPLWLVWLRYTVRPLSSGLRQEARHRGLAPTREIRRRLGARAVRRAGRFTLPGTPWWARWGLPTHAFGYFLGHPLQARTGLRLWADWEQRIRVVARTGWGKTSRLLVPIIRALPGPALVSSTEPGIFEQTVLARQFRRPALRWRWLSMLLRRWLPVIEYPIRVVDFSAPEQRYAAGYPRVRWSPIPGCEDFTLAYRRAVALVAGVDTDSGTARGGDADQFFRQSAAEVLAAWLHAAALGGKGIEDLLDWLGTTDDPVPGRILRDEAHADPSAAVNLRKHLDPAAGKTTSGVERYLTLSMNSLATAEGRELCGGHARERFDMAAFVATGGTVYLLADPSRIARARPLLSLFAAEMFLAAETAALRTRRKRLPRPYIAVLDELRYGVTVPNLPYVASAQRKFGIGYVYAVQSATQEDAVYGADAPALRSAAGVSIYGGIDIDSARELSERAGVTPVVTATQGPGTHTEHIQLQDTLTIGDQQQLADGEATVVVRGLAPFLAWVPSIYEQRTVNREISKEAEEVARQVAGARQRELATLRTRSAATAAGADFGQNRG
ncbi:MAG: type IV secretory system conjugative DNA transfer family protein [Pseudonocardiaceae bacterium]